MKRWLACLPALLFCFAVATTVQAEETFWIDVRTAEEYSAGHVSSAVNIPFTEITARINEVTDDPDAQIYVYCRSGRRSGIAMEALTAAGYTNVTNVGGLQDALAKARETAAE